jgi:hypothetical protein
VTIHVSCANCGTFDIAGPGHPAVECAHPPDVGCSAAGLGQHVLTTRDAFRHNHADDCEPHPETGHYPLTFTLMARVGPVETGQAT